MQERLNKFLSGMGVCSRREADRLIEAGKVWIDGHVAAMGEKVCEEQEVICNGVVVQKKQREFGENRPRPVLLAVHKPRGIVCTTSDKDRAPNIVDMIAYPTRVYYVGRLDKDSEGLVLMTNQGELVNQVMRSGNAHEKEYLVTIDRPVTKELLQKMSRGVYLKELDATTLACKAEKAGERAMRITLTQGLNRQIRRMCTACGCEVVRLVRLRVMNICLNDLKPGTYREVVGEEYQEFLRRLEGSSSAPGGAGRGRKPQNKNGVSNGRTD